MKKIIIGLAISFISFFSYINITKALQFHTADYIPGEYIIMKDSNGNKKYLTMQYIKDSDNKTVFCIEPFKIVSNNDEYTVYEILDDYPGLTKEQLNRITLIMYYGYGNPERQSNKWFVVTQFLIWETILGKGNIYFTGSLNGTQVDKYTNEINLIEKDIISHNTIPSFVHDYTINYKDSFILPELNNDYEILKKDYASSNDTYYKIDELTNDTSITFKHKKTTRYNNNIIIYDSINSQDIITQGDIDYPTYTINIKVTKGTALINILIVKDVYTIESDFSNTCFSITKENTLYDSFCTDTETQYETITLPYGTYDIKQTSNGIGYRKNIYTYSFDINSDVKKQVVYIQNYLLRNTINIKKYYCKEDDCLEEENAIFNVYDKDNNYIKELTTNEFGNTSITLGYGTYTIKQVKGKEEYTLSEDYRTKIVDETSKINKYLYNYYIEPPIEEPIIEEPEEFENITPPKTGVNYHFNLIAIIIILFLKKIITK